jgi:hypothetical protein
MQGALHFMEHYLPLEVILLLALLALLEAVLMDFGEILLVLLEPLTPLQMAAQAITVVVLALALVALVLEIKGEQDYALAVVVGVLLVHQVLLVELEVVAD